ncbi:putative germin-like protein 2-3 [Rhodamnia argentea]|uniref:Germin-like protein n=1 Tax=Rhodamnia argentea TaxID=178133 RepID=A0ABM3HVW6_9MYRT|nr:putative germin-like protein 2-3 [Rhodamnia argentea]
MYTLYKLYCIGSSKKTEMTKNLLYPCVLAIICAVATADEPSPLQDFCVADLTSYPNFPRVNGLPCLDAKLVQASHFSLSGFHLASNVSNPLGVGFVLAAVGQVPGLNTLGISMARADYAPGGVAPTHTHPQASEIITVLGGNLLVSFVTSNPKNNLISRVLRKGDVFIFPSGLIHFQKNVGCSNAVSIVAFSSQNIGTVLVANNVFGSTPPIADNTLAKAFQADKAIIDHIQSKFQSLAYLDMREFVHVISVSRGSKHLSKTIPQFIAIL